MKITKILWVFFSVLCCSLNGCVDIETVGQFDENEVFYAHIKQSPIINQLAPIKKGDDLYVSGGAKPGCAIVAWDNTDPLAKDRPQYSEAEIKILVEELQRISKEINFSRPLYVRDAFSARDRYVVGRHGKDLKAIRNAPIVFPPVVETNGTWSFNVYMIETSGDENKASWIIFKDSKFDAAPENAKGVLEHFSKHPEAQRKKGIFIYSHTFSAPVGEKSTDRWAESVMEPFTENLRRLVLNQRWRTAESNLVMDLVHACEKQNIAVYVNTNSYMRYGDQWKELTTGIQATPLQ